jgi:hypothetical protein
MEKILGQSLLELLGDLGDKELMNSHQEASTLLFWPTIQQNLMKQ